MNEFDAKLNRLRWRCRRGIKEVEILLQAFFERYYLTLTADRQALFERLLTCEDADLFEWLTHRSEPQDAQLKAMVDDLLCSLAA